MRVCFVLGFKTKKLILNYSIMPKPIYISLSVFVVTNHVLKCTASSPPYCVQQCNVANQNMYEPNYNNNIIIIDGLRARFLAMLRWCARCIHYYILYVQQSQCVTSFRRPTGFETPGQSSDYVKANTVCIVRILCELRRNSLYIYCTRTAEAVQF